MALANSLVRYLIRNGISYEVVAHPPTGCSSATAEVARVPCNRVAKSVVLKAGEAYMLAVLPASHRVRLDRLHQQLQCRIDLAEETELPEIFWDCAPGAVPPLGSVYGLDVIVDDDLLALPSVYFEGGDHLDLVKVRGEDFLRLLPGARHGKFSVPVSLDTRSA